MWSNMKKKIKIIFTSLIIISLLIDIVLLIPDTKNNRYELSSFYTTYSIEAGPILLKNGTDIGYPYYGNLIINYSQIAPDYYNITMQINLQIDQRFPLDKPISQFPIFNSTVHYFLNCSTRELYQYKNSSVGIGEFSFLLNNIPKNNYPFQFCSYGNDSLFLYPETSYFQLNSGLATETQLGTISAFNMISLRNDPTHSENYAFYEKSNLVLCLLNFNNPYVSHPLMEQLNLPIIGLESYLILESTNLHINKFINKDLIMVITWIADFLILVTFLIVYFKNSRNKTIIESYQRNQLNKAIKENHEK